MRIDNDNKIVFDQTNFDGTAIRANIKAITDFNTPVYKEIIIVKTGGCY